MPTVDKEYILFSGLVVDPSGTLAPSSEILHPHMDFSLPAEAAADIPDDATIDWVAVHICAGCSFGPGLTKSFHRLIAPAGTVFAGQRYNGGTIGIGDNFGSDTTICLTFGSDRSAANTWADPDRPWTKADLLSYRYGWISYAVNINTLFSTTYKEARVSELRVVIRYTTATAGGGGGEEPPGEEPPPPPSGEGGCISDGRELYFDDFDSGQPLTAKYDDLADVQLSNVGANNSLCVEGLSAEAYLEKRGLAWSSRAGGVVWQLKFKGEFFAGDVLILAVRNRSDPTRPNILEVRAAAGGAYVRYADGAGGWVTSEVTEGVFADDDALHPTAVLWQLSTTRTGAFQADGALVLAVDNTEKVSLSGLVLRPDNGQATNSTGYGLADTITLGVPGYLDCLGIRKDFTTPPGMGGPTGDVTSPCSRCPQPGGGSSTGGGGTTGDSSIPGTTAPAPTGTGTNLNGRGWVPTVVGDGTVPQADDPPEEPSLAGVRSPRYWLELRAESEPGAADATKRWSRIGEPLADPESFYGGQKHARIDSFGRVSRALSDTQGGFRSSSVTIRVASKHREVHELLASVARQLYDREATLWAIDDTDRRALVAGSARRLFHGVVRDPVKMLDTFLSELTLEDWLTSEFGYYSPNRTIGRLFTADALEGYALENTDLDGRTRRIVLGEVSDHEARDPITNQLAEKGLVPWIYIGPSRTDPGWDDYFVCDHAIHSTIDLFAAGLTSTDDTARVKMPASLEGVEFRTPGRSFPRYVTLANGDRVCMAQARGPRSKAHKNGQCAIAMNGVFLESTGDGTGTPIKGFFPALQLLHIEYIIRSGPTGNWQTVIPAFANGVPKVRTSDFLAAQTFTQGRIGGIGYEIGAVIEGDWTLRQLEREASLVGQCKFGFSPLSQLRVRLFDDLASIAGARHYRDPHIYGLTWEDVGGEIETDIPYRFDWDPDQQDFREPYRHAYSREGRRILGRDKPAKEPVDSRLVRHLPTIKDAMERRALRLGTAPRYVTLVLNIDAQDTELGDIILVTSDRGPGDGYLDHPLFIDEHHFDLDSGLTTLVCWDLAPGRDDAAYASSGGTAGTNAAALLVDANRTFRPVGSFAAGTSRAVGSYAAGTSRLVR